MKKDGFTLIELMIVIAIIAIVVTIIGRFFGGNSCPDNWEALTINDNIYIYVSPEDADMIWDMVRGRSTNTSIQVRACTGGFFGFGGGEYTETIRENDEVERGFDYD